MTPLQALATAQAYVIMADRKAMPEERASLVSLLGKHVSKNDISPAQVQRLTADAFAYVTKYEFADFLLSIESLLSPAQAISMMSNMYEAMIVDGNVVAREKELVEAFYRFFDLDRRVVNAIREILMVKNDTALFIRADHPNNGSDFRFGFVDRMDKET